MAYTASWVEGVYKRSETNYGHFGRIWADGDLYQYLGQSGTSNAGYIQRGELKMFCRKCGKEILEGEKFCKYCGAPSYSSAPQESVQGKRDESVPTVSEGNHGLHLLKEIVFALIKAGLLYFIMRSFSVAFDTNILTIDSLGISIFNPNGEEFVAFFAVIAAAEVFLAILASKFPTRIVDKLFLALPLIPTLKFFFIVITNIAQFFKSLNILYALLSIAAVIIGAYYCLCALVAPSSKKVTSIEKEEEE